MIMNPESNSNLAQVAFDEGIAHKQRLPSGAANHLWTEVGLDGAFKVN
jgi:hypothetical protein